MSSAQSPLTILYNGDRVTVDPGRITKDMLVPKMGHDGPRDADDLPGRVAAALFVAAESANALVVPDGLVIECYATTTRTALASSWSLIRRTVVALA